MKTWLAAFAAGVLALGAGIMVTDFAVAAPSGCGQYGAGKAPPDGFGQLKRLYTESAEPLLYGSCSNDTLSLFAGNSSDTLVWYTGFSWNNGEWVAHEYTGTRSPVDPRWINGTARKNISRPGVGETKYVIAYVCERLDGDWRCGCADSECSVSRRWAIQRFTREGTIDNRGAACGDAICQSGETDQSCPTDCAWDEDDRPECGNDICETGETASNCSSDCQDSENTNNGGGQYLCTPTTAIRTVRVTTSAQLTSAFSNAKPGDRIVLSSGTYPGEYMLSKSGTANAPIVVTSETPRGARITGTIVLPYSYTTLEALSFPGGGVVITGHHNRVTRSVFTNIPEGGAAIELSGTANNNRVDHNDISGPVGSDEGYGIRLLPSSSAAYGNHFDQNYIHDFAAGGDNNGFEGIQIGEGPAHTAYSLGTTIKNNLFARMMRETEIISLKSSGNTVWGNTFIDSPGKFMSNRHGSNNTWIANWAENIKGIEIFGHGTRIIDNRFVNASIRLGAGNMTQANLNNGLQSNEPDTPYPVAEDTLVTGNKVTGGSIELGQPDNGSLAVRGTELGANSAAVSGSGEGTTVVTHTVELEAVKLTPSQVGVDGADAYCGND